MAIVLPGLAQVAHDYDAILCDVWGVIHNGREAFLEACLALRAFRQARGPVVLITNAPVQKDRVTRLFPNLGVPMDCFDDCIASGDATRDVLRRMAPGPVYPIGLKGDTSLYEGIGIELTDDPACARLVCCTSLRDLPGGTPEPYRDELRALISYKLPMVCANPDVQFRRGDRLIWSAGALARIYEEEGGSVIRPGKPDAPIYALAFERASAIAGRAVDPKRTLAVGDGPATDVLGANRQGMDALFIGSGIHGHAMRVGEEFQKWARDVLAEDNVTARYAMPTLCW